MKVKQKTKYYLVLGIVIVAMFGIMIVPSVAAMLQKQITVSTGVNIYVDDKKLNPVDANGNPVEVFIYNGTTYLPVRAIADAVGKPVMWDGATKSVYLGRHDTDKPAVMLHKLDYFDSGGESVYKAYNDFKIHTDVKDNLGNSYDYGITTMYSGWRTYYINGKYTRMKGKYVLNYGNRSSELEDRLKIYGDGELVYKSPIMTGGIHPIDFEIDLRGVLELKISKITVPATVAS
jgi:hypothetical protein